MSSSNNTSTYYVKLRDLSFDAQEVGPQVGALDLGKLDAAQLVKLLRKVAELNVSLLVDANPHVLLYGGRGIFTVKPYNGSLRLQPTGQFNVSPVEMTPEEVPEWLDQTVEHNSAAVAALINKSPTNKRYLVMGAMLASLIVLVFSIYHTFKSHPLISENSFNPIASKVQLTRLTDQVVGHYVNAAGVTNLLVRPDGNLTCVEVDAFGATQDETVDTYNLANMTGRGPVIRAFRLGVIFISNSDTLVFNGENFVRKTG
jgi:hypothetical protein